MGANEKNQCPLVRQQDDSVYHPVSDQRRALDNQYSMTEIKSIDHVKSSHRNSTQNWIEAAMAWRWRDSSMVLPIFG